MAHVTYTDIDDGATRSVAALNTFLASYQTQSTNVSAENWLDEGIDERNCASGVATDGWDRDQYDGGIIGAPIIAGAFATLVLGATTFQLDNGGLGWTVGQGYGVVRVRFKTVFEFAYGATPSETLSVRLVYQEDGGAVTVVPNSTRTFQARQAVAIGVTVPEFRGNMKYAFLAPYTADAASHTLNLVRVQIQTGAAGYYFGNTTFQAVRFTRSVAA